LQATDEQAGWLDRELGEKLGSLVTLVPRERLVAAMTKQGVKGASSCNDSCLAALGKALGADRVIRQTLSTQRKVQSPGYTWVWILHQVHVQKGAPFGHFERAGVRPRTYWREWAKEMADKLAGFDPAKRLALKKRPPVKPTKGPKEVPGMVYVPAGEYIMGSEWGEPDELPRHIVRVDAFYLDKYEVTNEAYEKCVDAKVCGLQSTRRTKGLMGPKQPAAGVSWHDAARYCKWVNKRLPTEAEWEWAARGNDERRYPWGNEWNPKWANMHHDLDGYKLTAPVGSFPKNVSPFGIYDMAGNVWEWTQDWFDRDYYARSPRDNPKGPETGKRRVMRGGSWYYDVPFYLVTHNRSPGWPQNQKPYFGLRCAMDVQ
jgi:iron(II)-dependent oxidoreductase